jgi:hypothetical protein
LFIRRACLSEGRRYLIIVCEGPCVVGVRVEVKAQIYSCEFQGLDAQEKFFPIDRRPH